jgi:acylglycerol lipase
VEARQGSFAGAGGLRIHWQAWEPEGRRRAAIVLAHGVSEHVGRYGHLLDRALPTGYCVHALDHRGHGHSEGRRAVIDRLARALADLDAFVDLVRDEHPDGPLFLLGHSMGGAFAISYALEHQDKLDGLILSSPAAALGSASPVERALGKLLSRVAPSLGVLDVDPDAISHDPAEVEAYRTDPLVHHGKLPARTVAELTAAIDSYPDRVGTLTLPLLAFHGSADRLTPPEGSRIVHDGASSQDKTLRIYDGLYHEMLNETPADRERVLDDLMAWLDERAPAAG